MSKSLQLAFLISYIATISCTPEHRTSESGSQLIINVDLSKAKEYPISEVFSITYYIPLETDTSNLIGMIEKVVKIKNKFYLSTGKTLFVYSDNGKMLQYLKKTGEAEGEYRSITDFWIDPDSENIEIMDRKGQKIITFSSEGNFINEWKFGINANSFKKMDPETYVFHCSTYQSSSDLMYTLILKSKTTNKIIFKSFPIDPKQAEFLNFTDYNNFVSMGDMFTFLTSGNDTIYSFNRDKLEAKYVLDFKDKKIPNSFLTKSYPDVSILIEALSKTSYAGTLNAFVYEDENQLISMPTIKAYPTGKLDKVYVFYNKTNGETKVASRFNDDMYFIGHKDEISYESRPVGFSPGELYSVVETADILDRINSMKKSMSESEFEKAMADNPGLSDLSKNSTLASNPALKISVLKETRQILR